MTFLPLSLIVNHPESATYSLPTYKESKNLQIFTDVLICKQRICGILLLPKILEWYKCTFNINVNL